MCAIYYFNNQRYITVNIPISQKDESLVKKRTALFCYDQMLVFCPNISTFSNIRSFQKDQIFVFSLAFNQKVRIFVFLLMKY